MRIAKGKAIPAAFSSCAHFLHAQPALGSQAPLPADQTFSTYYGEKDYPLVRVLQEPVHVEVRLLQRTDPSLVLVLHECWATPSANPFQQPQWPILSDG
jgi:hypothetical protein